MDSLLNGGDWVLDHIASKWTRLEMVKNGKDGSSCLVHIQPYLKSQLSSLKFEGGLRTMITVSEVTSQ